MLSVGLIVFIVIIFIVTILLGVSSHFESIESMHQEQTRREKAQLKALRRREINKLKDELGDDGD